MKKLNWKQIWLAVLIGSIIIFLTSGWWGWHLEGWLIGG